MNGVLGHYGGIDEFAFVALPILIFFALQWLSRRKQRREQETGTSGTNDSGVRETER